MSVPNASPDSSPDQLSIEQLLPADVFEKPLLAALHSQVHSVAMATSEAAERARTERILFGLPLGLRHPTSRSDTALCYNQDYISRYFTEGALVSTGDAEWWKSYQEDMPPARLHVYTDLPTVDSYDNSVSGASSRRSSLYSVMSNIFCNLHRLEGKTDLLRNPNTLEDSDSTRQNELNRDVKRRLKKLSQGYRLSIQGVSSTTEEGNPHGGVDASIEELAKVSNKTL